MKSPTLQRDHAALKKFNLSTILWSSIFPPWIGIRGPNQIQIHNTAYNGVSTLKQILLVLWIGIVSMPIQIRI